MKICKGGKGGKKEMEARRESGGSVGRKRGQGGEMGRE